MSTKMAKIKVLLIENVGKDIKQLEYAYITRQGVE